MAHFLAREATVSLKYMALSDEIICISCIRRDSDMFAESQIPGIVKKKKGVLRLVKHTSLKCP